MTRTRSSGVDIDFEVIGEGEPFVLLHGLMGRRDLWRVEGWLDDLADLRLILPDARGHGRSERPMDEAAYTPAADAADVVACLDALGVRKAAVCGMSMGAATAITVAALHPERVTAVAALGLPGDGLPFADTLVDDLEWEQEWAGNFERNGMRWVVEALMSEGRPEWARILGEADAGAMARRIRGVRAAGRLPERLHDIRQPLLVVWAEVEVPDPPLPLPDQTRVVVLPGVDHVGVMEHPELVVPELRHLLAARDAGSSAG